MLLHRNALLTLDLLDRKPAGYNVACRGMRIGSTAGSRAFVALNRRHYSSTRAVLQDCSNDAPRFIHVQDQEDTIGALRSGKPVGGELDVCQLRHVIDYFTMLGRGAVVEVSPLSAGTLTNLVVAAKILFESGDIGLYQAVWDAGSWADSDDPTKRWEMRPWSKHFSAQWPTQT